jgi:hypothetical protein
MTFKTLLLAGAVLISPIASPALAQDQSPDPEDSTSVATPGAGAAPMVDDYGDE